MAKPLGKLASDIKDLKDSDKLKLVDQILTSLHRPDPAMDKIWAKEAGKRLASLKSGRSRAVSYKDALAKYRSR